VRYYEIARHIAILIGTNERASERTAARRLRASACKVAPWPINHVPSLLCNVRSRFDQEAGIRRFAI